MSNPISSGPPQVLREEVLATRGNWIIRGRVVLYHGDRLRRCEMTLEHQGPVRQETVGWTVEELAGLYSLLVTWKLKVGE